MINIDNFSQNDEIQYICTIDLDLYKCKSKNILTNEVVLTKNRDTHVREERKREVLIKYRDDLSEIFNDPDYIIDDESRENTVKVIKYMSDTNIHIALKLIVAGDENPHYKNSIITAWEMGNKKLNQLLRNKTVLYKKEK